MTPLEQVVADKTDYLVNNVSFKSIARELLAARKVVEAIKEQAKEAQGRGVISINVWSAIYAYDAATKGE